MFKKIITSLCLFSLILSFSSFSFADSRSEVIKDYKSELPSDFGDKQGKAESETDAVIDSMEASQSEVAYTISGLDKRVKNININDPKKDNVNDQLKIAKSAADDFEGYDAKSHLQVISGGYGVLPRIYPSNSFQEAESKAIDKMNQVNRVLINPKKPGNVPEGDIIDDFLPQLIRQLFRFAWIAILVALVISSVMFIVSHDNEERVTKAKNMIIYTLVGFAAVTLAFAIVKALTDIDFFRFI